MKDKIRRLKIQEIFPPVRYHLPLKDELLYTVSIHFEDGEWFATVAGKTKEQAEERANAIIGMINFVGGECE